MTTNILTQLQTTKTIDELTEVEVNELAVLAKTDENAMWLLKAHFTPQIEKLREKNWHYMNNDTHFVNDAENRIYHAVKDYNSEIGNFSARVYRLFMQSIAKYCGKRGTLRKKTVIESKYNSMADEENSNPFDQLVSTARELEVGQASPEETALQSADIEELKAIYCKKETDEIIFDIITKENTYGGLTHYDIARRLADITGKSFHSARSALRTFIKNRKAEVAF
ncbi:hypothetical protein LWL40_27595 (plasmid) [Bacillus thuringiensis]|uniref:hypothetical protein n=1 Tax=Bacillus thuringiensis TaxID=1428 RepID=UPI003D748C5F